MIINKLATWFAFLGLGRHFQLTTACAVAPPGPDGSGRPIGTGRHAYARQ